MRLGDLLVRAKLVFEEQMTAALVQQAEQGGRLGDILIATGVLTQTQLDKFLYRTPTEPEALAAINIDKNDLIALLMKLIHVNRLESGRQFEQALKLPYHIVLELVRAAIERKLLYSRGVRGFDNTGDLSYSLTEEGQRFAAEALEHSRYVGPAPVTLDEFTFQVNLQKLTNEAITFDRIREAMGSLVIDENVVEQVGPALSSGSAMLLYGPSGNGKTTFATLLTEVFSDLIYVPYSVIVEGQIIQFLDSRIHVPAEVNPIKDPSVPSFMRENSDARWVAIKRPFVVTGGELTLEMLDLHYDALTHTYEAPLHMKVLGGCFVVDDFGRQLASPTRLLNRWIVPLESRVDFLKLHTGKSFSIPFEQLVVFSTNLDPNDLMDEAFLRRLPYKIYVGSPDVTRYKAIFAQECLRQNVKLTDEVLDAIVHRVSVEEGIELAVYQPKFIVDQMVAMCRFWNKPTHFEPRFIGYAIENLRVRTSTKKKQLAC